MVAGRMGRLLDAFISVFIFEKVFQHFLTALFYLVDIPGIGKPDSGDFLHLSFQVLALLNLIMFAGFLLGVVWKFNGVAMFSRLVGVLAVLDVVFEFIFHGFFFITVSVIVSLLLLILLSAERRLTTTPATYT